MKTITLAVFLAAAALAKEPPKTKNWTAEDWAAKAARHEAAAERIKANQGYNAMRYKWPALANGAENKERELARQAREAAAAARLRQAPVPSANGQ